MPVKIQQTPNPNARKFVLPAKYFAQPLSFAGADAAAAHPLAAQLFALGLVYNVFMVQDFITINKVPDADWALLEQRVSQLIANHFEIE